MNDHESRQCDVYCEWCGWTGALPPNNVEEACPACDSYGLRSAGSFVASDQLVSEQRRPFAGPAIGVPGAVTHDF